jgi:hypothetical protein
VLCTANYLLLRLVEAIILAGPVLDLWGAEAARKLTPGFLGAALVFFLAARLASGTFLVFLAYEAAAMLFALGVYAALALRRALPGAGWMAAGIALSLTAAGIEARRAVAFTVIWPFDHHGVFHLVQAVGVLAVLRGLSRGMPER